MTPEALAALHKRAFVTPRPWTAAEFGELLAASHVFVIGDVGGFILGRAVADQAELLTLAVDPARRRRGRGRQLVRRFEEEAAIRGANRIFLEVSAENAAAVGLYLTEGYAESGRRRGYYRDVSAQPVDAIVMSKPLVPVPGG